MIFTSIAPDTQIVISEQEPWPDRPKHLKYDHFLEYMGGLGDVLHRLYSHDDYFKLFRMEPGERAAVVLMSHNPGVLSIFRNLPLEISRNVDIYDFGFTTPFHPWENEEWRHFHGMPRKSKCPGGVNRFPLTFFPAPEDYQLLMSLPFERFVVFSTTAREGGRQLPREARESIARSLSLN